MGSVRLPCHSTGVEWVHLTYLTTWWYCATYFYLHPPTHPTIYQVEALLTRMHYKVALPSGWWNPPVVWIAVVHCDPCMVILVSLVVSHHHPGRNHEKSFVNWSELRTVWFRCGITHHRHWSNQKVVWLFILKDSYHTLSLSKYTLEYIGEKMGYSEINGILA